MEWNQPLAFVLPPPTRINQPQSNQKLKSYHIPRQENGKPAEISKLSRRQVTSFCDSIETVEQKKNAQETYFFDIERHLPTCSLTSAMDSLTRENEQLRALSRCAGEFHVYMLCFVK